MGIGLRNGFMIVKWKIKVEWIECVDRIRLEEKGIEDWVKK